MTVSRNTAGNQRPPEPAGKKLAVFNAAVDLFFRKGYEAATLRQIASVVGLQVGSLYNHLGSKQDLLFDIMYGVMDDLLHEMTAALDHGADPIERMQEAVRCHMVFHATRMQEVFIGNSELRSLTPANRSRVIRLRDEYERLIQATIEDGREAGVFQVDDVKIATYSVLAMCTGVSSWYSVRGRLTVQELVRLYSRMVLRLLGVPESAHVGNLQDLPPSLVHP